jgi:flagellar basal-body rod protein FlgF
MDSPSYIALSRMASQMRAQDVIANNLANADTPGYRQSRSIFAEHPAMQALINNPRGGRQVAYSWDRATWRDDTQGQIQTTGNPLDVAITGEGYFAVETQRGIRYTRSGRFTIGANGQLVDAQGNAVLNTQGRPIAIAANDTRIEIKGDGTIRSENGVIGQIQLSRFANAQALRAEGDRLLDPAVQQAEPVERPRLTQGAVEGSNVQPVLEMTRMIAETREFQLVTNFVEKENERLSGAVDRILRKR